MYVALQFSACTYMLAKQNTFFFFPLYMMFLQIFESSKHMLIVFTSFNPLQVIGFQKDF